MVIILLTENISYAFTYNVLVELLDQMSEVLDNMTISFETLDTCFCYGYCGCTVRYQLHCIHYVFKLVC